MASGMNRWYFADRAEAGRLLGEEAASRRFGPDAIVLALPRGGVPVAFALASRLHLPLDVVVVRKIGVPWQPELAMGAIAGHARVLDERLIDELAISRAEVDTITARERAEMMRREELYREGKPPLDVKGKTTILVDDGLAMGSTMLAAVRYVRAAGAVRIVVAAPVGSRQACERLAVEADDIICLESPEPFEAVGQWFRKFDQTSDAEVMELLAAAHRSPAAA
jgi:putative phosphoribosyl transferase